MGTSYRVASDFLTADGTAQIDGARIVMRNGDTVARTAILSIWTDSGSDAPGTMLGEFAPINVPAGSAVQEYDTTAAPAIQLFPNTRYWLVARPGEGNTGPPETLAFRVGNNDVADAGSTFAAVSGGGGLSSNDAGGTWSDDGLHPLFSLSGTGGTPLLVSVTPSDPDAAEPSDNGEFTVSLPEGEVAPAGGLTVNLGIGGTATAGSDYVAIASSVVIPAGSDSVTVAVTVSDDTDSEVTESVILTALSTETWPYAPDAPPFNAATVTIAEEAGDQDSFDTARAETFAPEVLADPALEDTVWGNGANPDGDAWPNIYDLVFGQDQDNPDPETPVEIGNTDGCNTLTFRALKELPPGVEIKFVVSDSPTGGFRDSTSPPKIVPDPDNPLFNIITFDDDTPASAGRTRFAKLVITEN